MADNPLATQQRETKGAETFGKYDYQYHWALCRMLDQHKRHADYAVFVEHHEDVVLADSLDAKAARFEFNQIKCKEGKPYTVVELTSIPNGSSNSVLGKLIASSAIKPFKSAISTINLVATNGFNSAIIQNGLSLQVITTADMSKEALGKFSAEMKTELNINEIPTGLRFILPDLPSKGHQEFVIGRIAELIESLFPLSSCKSTNIYRLLIDELHRKGQAQYDYTQWEELLKDKALTSGTVKSVISKNTSIAGLEIVQDDCKKISEALGLKPRAAKRLYQDVVRYFANHIAVPSPVHLNLARVVKRFADNNPDAEYVEMISELEKHMDSTIRTAMGDARGLRAAIIYELIQVEND